MLRAADLAALHQGSCPARKSARAEHETPTLATVATQLMKWTGWRSAWLPKNDVVIAAAAISVRLGSVARPPPARGHQDRASPPRRRVGNREDLAHEARSIQDAQKPGRCGDPIGPSRPVGHPGSDGRSRRLVRRAFRAKRVCRGRRRDARRITEAGRAGCHARRRVLVLHAHPGHVRVMG